MVGQRKIKLAYLVSHPIQYQAPLLRLIAGQPEIDFTTFFLNDSSIGEFRDAGFGETIKWDVPLLDGYRHQFLPAISAAPLSLWRAMTFRMMKRIEADAFDVLWVHGYAHYRNVEAVLSAKRHQIKVLMRGESNLIGGSSNAVKRMIKSRLFARCNGFLCIGSLNRDFYRQYGVPEEKLFDMPYAVDNAFFRQQAEAASGQRESFRLALGLAQGRQVIMYVGKLQKRKRPSDLLEAYIGLSADGKLEPEPYLLYVGAGEELEALKARAKRTSWRSILFLGFQNQKRLPALFDLCDMFVLPSANEPWGLVVNEAMNAGKPIIVSDQVGCGPDLVKNGKNGFIFHMGDVTALTGALKAVLQDREKQSEMGRESFRIIGAHGFEQDVRGLKQALDTVMRR